MPLTVLDEKVLGSVGSTCSTCLAPLTATVVVMGGDVYLRKFCPTHGEETVLESRGLDFYHYGVSSCCGSGKIDEGAEPLGPSCVALIEITDACNLECPLCFASSGPRGTFFMSPEEFRRRLDRVIERRGPLDILMISGGEPTVHPQFSELLTIAAEQDAVKMIMLNTNGVAFTTSEEVRKLIERHREKVEVYLQLDPLSEIVTEELRGAAPLLRRKLDALAWLNEAGVCVTIAAVLTRTVCLNAVRGLLELALTTSSVRGITFQPAFASGRHKPPFDPIERMTTPEAVNVVCRSYPEIFARSAFTNLPCSHPNCAIVAYYYRARGKLWPLLEEIVPDQSLANRINFSLEDLKRCGCDTTDLGQYIRSAELSSEHSFRVVIKPFMDRFNLNRNRTEQCCTHVVGPEGKLMSFCEYNVFREGFGWNTNS